MTNPLAGLTGTFTGSGLNVIFRPQNPASPAALPTPVPTSDNILQLSLTSETLTFTTDIGSVVNRGFVQPDITLSGAAYLQIINDVTDPNNPVAIHYEPGVWMATPQTTDPALPPTVFRLGAIAHGASINAQGTYTVQAGAPVIPPMNTADTVVSNGINPFVAGEPSQLVPTPSLTAAAQGTARIPQNLSSQVSAGTITQAILDDPNTLLRNALAGKNVTSTTTLTVSTEPAAPLFGGGVDAIAFLLGDTNPNAQVLRARATFYIETITAKTKLFGFWPVTRTYTQLQYSQEVLLNFNGNVYPHISVATLTN